MKPTILPRLPRTGERRLLKLIAALEAPMPKGFKFDFGEVYEPHKCGTVGCAIGMTPILFPGVITLANDGFGHAPAVRNHLQFASCFSVITKKLFGANLHYLFALGSQSQVHHSLPNLKSNAKPKQVAKMLRQYLKLTHTPLT